MDKLKQLIANKQMKNITVQQKIKQKRQKQYKQKQQEQKLQVNRMNKKQQQYRQFYSNTRKLIKIDNNNKDKIIKNSNDYDELFEQKLKDRKLAQELDAKLRSRLIQPRLADEIAFRQKKINMIENQTQTKFQDKCDQIYLWIHKVLGDWGETINAKYHTQEEKFKGKAAIARYEETVHDLCSFREVLKAKKGDQQMITSIYHIMNCCLVRQFSLANLKYIQLSIGNAPWPMGEQMLGITVRRNKQRLSHVLSSELTRKWMQALKKIISISQQLYPNEDKSKMINYSVNSLL